MAMRITRVYTRKGDSGTTSLAGGQVVRKDSVRVKSYGAIDELNSVLGLAVAFEPVAEVAETLVRIQNELFTLGSELCMLPEDQKKWPVPTVQPSQVENLENILDRLNGKLQPLAEFILPGGSRVSGFLHQARCVCRRAETLIVELTAHEPVNPVLLQYVNRLSDLLFVLARYDNFERGIPDVFWQKP